MKRLKGFTLIELLLVIAIMGILSAVAIPRIFDYRKEALESTTKNLLSNVRTAIQNWRVNKIVQEGNNVFPGADDIYNVLEGGVSTFPENPYNQLKTINVVTGAANRNVFQEGGVDSFGWVYNRENGTFYANSDTCTASGSKNDPCSMSANNL